MRDSVDAGWMVGLPLAAAAALIWRAGVTGFLHWYLVITTGSSLAFALAAVMTNLDDHPGLISLNYFSFCAAVEEALDALGMAWMLGMHGAERPSARRVIRLAEFIIATVLTYVGPLLLIGWEWILAPFMYPLYAVLGAPARVVARSPGVTYQGPKTAGWARDPADVPDGVEEISIAHRGVTFTAILTAAALWIVSQIF